MLAGNGAIAPTLDQVARALTGDDQALDPKRTALARDYAARNRIERMFGYLKINQAVAKDPDGHNRDAAIWEGELGYFGHSQVPENTHWDPAYSKLEADYLLGAEFDEKGGLLNPDNPAVWAPADRPLSLDKPEPDVMHDHSDVGEPE